MPTRVLLLVLLVVSAALCLGRRALASEVQLVDSKECTVRLTGEIVPGDREKVQRGLQLVSTRRGGAGAGDYIRNMIVCLDSPGGSYDEGLRLTEFFIEEVVKTKVEQSATCLSACAIAFMGGTQNEYEAVHQRSRQLHFRGRLGFHSPYLKLPNGQYSGETVANSFATAIAAFGKLVGMKRRRMDEEPIVDPNLIAELARYGPNEAFMIDTVGKAAQYGIELVGGDRPRNISSRSVCNVCLNWFGVKRDDLERLSRDCMTRTGTRRGSTFIFDGYGRGGEVDGLCIIKLQRQYSSDPGICSELVWQDGDEAVPIQKCHPVNINWSFYSPPQTLLKDLAGNTIARHDDAQRSSVAGWPPAVPSPPLAGPTFWSHNGSTMRLVADGARRRFYYESPRQGMRAEGVTSGTLLFDGARSGDGYAGTAYIFSGRCGRKYAYQVSGTVSSDERSVTMYGQAPRPDARCNVSSHRHDELVFELMGE